MNIILIYLFIILLMPFYLAIRLRRLPEIKNTFKIGFTTWRNKQTKTKKKRKYERPVQWNILFIYLIFQCLKYIKEKYHNDIMCQWINKVEGNFVENIRYIIALLLIMTPKHLRGKIKKLSASCNSEYPGMKVLALFLI